MKIREVLMLLALLSVLGCEKAQAVSSSAIAASSIANSSVASEGACTMDGPVCPDSLPKSDSSLKQH